MRKLYQSLIPFFIFFLVFSTVEAQEATFYENFDNTELGELPEGWSYHQKGGSSPSSRWIVSKKDRFGSKLAWSNWADEAIEGSVDEDWLITPQITPKNGDFLIFDASQVFVSTDYGSKYHILISTGSAKPEDFKDTLASYTESEFPGYEETLDLDLAAYPNQPIYIAFVHENGSSNMAEVDDWYLDNVWVRAKQPADFFSGEVYHQGKDVVPVNHSATSVVIGVKVTIIGDYDLANITSFTFSTKGSTIDPSLIASASLYSTGQDPFIGTNDDENDIQGELFGTTSNPGKTFEIEGNMDLPVGDSYFWLFYTINSFSPEFPYLHVDASFEKALVNGKENDVQIKEQEGFRPVVPSRPINDSIKNSIALSANGGRYGSYNSRATPEPEYEKLAYCAPDGFNDVANSIWWHFKAPSDGYITADLSSTDFNTILLILDKNLDQFACNDNISNDELQSKISEYEVKAGQELYFRVTGAGNPNDPNGPAGVVIMDFAFTNGPLGTDDPLKNKINLSAPYPNPTKDKTNLDFELKEPAKVSFEVRDVLGKSVWKTKDAKYAPGLKHTVSIDGSGWATGTYILHVKSNKIEASKKLIITR